MTKKTRITLLSIVILAATFVGYALMFMVSWKLVVAMVLIRLAIQLNDVLSYEMSKTDVPDSED